MSASQLDNLLIALGMIEAAERIVSLACDRVVGATDDEALILSSDEAVNGLARMRKALARKAGV